MTRLPHNVLARLRAKARQEQEQEERSGERLKPSFVASSDQKMRWLGSETLRAPSEGHAEDVVKLPRRRRG